MHIVMMVGNIGCGKSTAAKEFAKKNYYVFNDDAISYMIGCGEYKYSSKDSAMYLYMMREFIGYCNMRDINCVIDTPNMTIGDRQYICNLISEDSTVTVIDYGPGVLSDLVRRLNDNRGVDDATWERVFDNLKNDYEKPDLEFESCDEIIKMY